MSLKCQFNYRWSHRYRQTDWFCLYLLQKFKNLPKWCCLIKIKKNRFWFKLSKKIVHIYTGNEYKYIINSIISIFLIIYFLTDLSKVLNIWPVQEFIKKSKESCILIIFFNFIFMQFFDIVSPSIISLKSI